jgi:hypothetical protein
MSAERKPVHPLEKVLNPLRIRRGKPQVRDGKVYALPDDGPREVTILVGDLSTSSTQSDRIPGS